MNATPALADIHLDATSEGAHELAITVLATARTGSKAAALNIVIAESGLVSRVRAGENRGATLQHGHVVRQWIGPLPLQNGHIETRRTVTLPDAWDRAHLEVGAFVQDQGDGRVLQAASSGQCLEEQL